jgi:TonB family protein
MLGFRKFAISLAALVLAASANVSSSYAQGKLTYPELNTALRAKLPNRVFSTKTELFSWLVTQIQRRKVDKPLTPDREDDLRQAGATDELIETIRTNSPAVVIKNETPSGPVDLGNLTPLAVNLVRPEYTQEALQAGTTGEVKLSLELDEQGRVTSVSRLSVLPNGLTERAIEAARKSTFRPASRNGKPARATGLLTFNFKITVNIAAVLASAEELRSRGDCDRAIAEYTKVLNTDVRNAKAAYGRGSCYLIKGDYDKALPDMDSAVTVEPNNAEMLLNLGLVRDFRGEHAEGADAYARALALNATLDAQPTFNCLYIDRRGMSPEQARTVAGKFINSCTDAMRGANPRMAAMLQFKRGIAYRLKGDYEKAIADLDNVRRANPWLRSLNTQFLVLYNNRGLEASNKKEYKKAYDDITLAIQSDPKNPTPYINRCTIYLYGWKQYDEAIRDCTEAIKLSTKSSMAYNHRGYAYELKNNLSDALADYQTAVQMDPKNEIAKTNLNRVRSKAPSLKN